MKCTSFGGGSNREHFVLYLNPWPLNLAPTVFDRNLSAINLLPRLLINGVPKVALNNLQIGVQYK